MGTLQIEHNTQLALRPYNTEGRYESECLPKNPQPGQIYDFLKRGQRVYDLQEETPLGITEGNEKITKVGLVKILCATHEMYTGKTDEKEEVWTRGRYQVTELE